jgi:hypothetical protein
MPRTLATSSSLSEYSLISFFARMALTAGMSDFASISEGSNIYGMKNRIRYLLYKGS